MQDLTMAILATIPLILIIILVWGISVGNGIIATENKVKRSWSDVLVYEQQKNNIIPKLEDVVKQFKNYETDFQSKIVELRTLSNGLSRDEVDLEKLKEIEAKSEKLIKAINVTVENYPELKADKMFSNLMSEIVEQQENISSAIRIFNNNAEKFNTYVQIFPNSIINNNFNKKEQFRMFELNTETEIGFNPSNK